ncbi:MAG TPA: hypothetical protein VEB68_08055 [Croceibacterium sp.]|nr:hypothetical protein [Solirubrobacterales bacterium]HYD24736.1 hypothetical protein [Croceibacterium sp.]
MLRPVLPLAILALGVTGTLIHAATPALAALGPVADIEWSYRAAPEPHLRVIHDGMNSTFDADELPEVMDALAAASPRSPGEAVSFSLAREAGALACSGVATGRTTAAGTCRFDPSGAFVAGLTERGLRPEDGDELLALALVDARMASVDALSRAGFNIEEAQDLIAVAALEVSAQYAAELRGAGLVIDELEDLIAARALDLDAEWLEGMAAAGYPNLTVNRAIAMRALDVTPEYARRMKQVVAALGEPM